MDKFVKVLCVLGASLLLTVSFGMVILILCPGVSIFGVRYVGFAQEEVKYKAEVVDLKQDVIVESNALGVDIVFNSSRTTAKLDISQAFIGFTTKKMGEEYYTIARENGATKITFLDVPTIVFGTNRNGSAIKLELPSSLNSLSITSKSSTLNLSGAGINARTVNIDTNGVVNVNNAVNSSVFEVHNATLNVNGSLSGGTTLKVDTFRAVNVNKASSATLDIQAKGSTVSVMSCGNLKVKTTTGKVIMKPGSVVAGNCDIETVSGDIKLNVLDGKLAINTKYGDVSADYVKRGDILSGAGDVKIRSVDNVAIESSSGDIELMSVNNKATVTTTSGAVKLSSADAKNTNEVKNVSVETRSGDVTAYNLAGEKAKIVTMNGRINVNVCKADKLVLASEKAEIKASGVSCVSSQISSNGKITVGYTDKFEQANIFGGDGAVSISLAEHIKCNIVATASNEKAKISVDGYAVSGVSYSNDNSSATGSLKVKTSRGNVEII